MAAHSVLQVQELCDYIVDFLHDHPETLKPCALVSPRLASSAQYHLFQEIRFGDGVKWNDAGACRRFCAVLNSSPHLAPLVQRIRACFTPDVLSQLCEVKLPNLSDLVLFRPLKDKLTPNDVPKAARLIGFPSIRHLKLQDLVFIDIDVLSRLFQQCTHPLDSLALSHITIHKHLYFGPSVVFRGPANAKVKIKTLSFDSISNSHWWLLDPQLPFDLSGLEDVDLGGTLSVSWLSLLESNRLSIRKLRIYAQDAINPKFTKSPIPPTVLASLPVLTYLTIGSLGEELQDVETLLEGLPPTNRLALLRIDIMTRPREDGLRQLGAACASIGTGCTVEVNLWQRYMSSGLGASDMAGLVRAAFGEPDGKGRGRLVMRVDGAVIENKRRIVE
ncbi:hypothetical protein MVEN_01158600 [Mycena venus]|uniref:Uncharacterized protein n=1 Tax=Mycena venus TaxID=2733690 RepID=A0A8H6Y5C4_9AGAR|nr:hypothetical protein MVEN_01158600 [Mycena venus]